MTAWEPVPEAGEEEEDVDDDGGWTITTADIDAMFRCVEKLTELLSQSLPT